MIDVELEEPEWFAVRGGPPPTEVLLRDGLAGLLTMLVVWVFGLLLAPTARLLLLAVAGVSGAATLLGLRRRWQQRQQVRIYGNILEHRSGTQTVRVVLSRATQSALMAPPGLLVLTLDDGRGTISLARRAAPEEIGDLSPCFGPFLELGHDDFEQVRYAASRPYPQA
jgi:hypothetical protein